jgi:hypothetical protein
MLRKCFCLLVVMSLLSSLIACSGKSEKEEAIDTTTVVTTKTEQTTKAVQTTSATQQTAESTTAEPENPFKEKMVLNFLTGQESAEFYVEGRWDELELEELFNVDLKLWNIRIKSGANDQVTMMLAAGDVPDWGFYYYSGKKMYQDGLSRSVPLDKIKQFLPSYYEQIEKDPTILRMNSINDKSDPNDGDLYGLNFIAPTNFFTFNAALWRKDWLENLGYDFENLRAVPSEDSIWDNRIYLTTTFFTVDDVKELFRALTEDDPDGNGEDDTYGALHTNFTQNDMYITTAMFGFHNSASHLYLDPVTGDYVPYYAYIPYRDMWNFLKEMLDKGYVNRVPGLVSGHTEPMQLWATGKYGLVFTPYNRIFGYLPSAEGWPPKTIVEGLDPDATFVITRPMGAGKYVPYGEFGYSTYDYVVGKQVDDEKLERLFMLLEYSYFGENWFRYKFGIEGIHYKWAGEPWNSEIFMTPLDMIPVKYRGEGIVAGTGTWGVFGNLHFIPDVNTYLSYNPYIVAKIEYWNEFFPGGYYSHDLWIRPDKLLSSATMPTDLYDEFVKLKNESNADITAVHKDFMNRLYEGQVINIYEEWTQYIDQIYAAGMAEWVEIFNNEEFRTYSYYAGLE